MRQLRCSAHSCKTLKQGLHVVNNTETILFQLSRTPVAFTAANPIKCLYTNILNKFGFIGSLQLPKIEEICACISHCKFIVVHTTLHLQDLSFQHLATRLVFTCTCVVSLLSCICRTLSHSTNEIYICICVLSSPMPTYVLDHSIGLRNYSCHKIQCCRFVPQYLEIRASSFWYSS